jgi:hypothetical protein
MAATIPCQMPIVNRGARYRRTDLESAAPAAGCVSSSDLALAVVVNVGPVRVFIADTDGMDHLVDLDVVGAQLEALRDLWASEGVRVSEFTWRDEAASWPQPITPDRSSVVLPESLGMVFTRADDNYAELVLWTGGWADFRGILGGEIVLDVPDFKDTAECVAVAEAIAVRVVNARPWPPLTT